MIYRYGKNRLVYSVGEKIKPDDWNFTKQRARAGNVELNRKLDRLDKMTPDLRLKLENEGTEVTPLRLKEEINRTLNKNKVTLISFIEDYTKTCGKRKTTIAKFNAVLTKLKNFPFKTNWGDINADWFEKYVMYLERKDFRPNTIEKHIRVIKQFLNEATERKINTNLDFRSKRFKSPTEDPVSVYLSVDELTRIKNAELGAAYRKTADLFLIGAFTGLRFSDFSLITKDHENNGVIRVRQKKTGAALIIPVHPVVRDILDKYDTLPRCITNQKMNVALKNIAEKAGINDKTTITSTKGGVKKTTTYFKYQLITTHTARRSFCTNAYLAGIPVPSIMKISGHTKESTFLKYIRISQQENADLLKSHPFFQGN